MKRLYWFGAGAVLIAIIAALALWPTQARRQAARQSSQVAAMAQAWNGEIAFENTYAALNPYENPEGAGTGATLASDFNPNDEFWGLPRNPGYEEVAYNCASCHSLQLVMQQRRNAARWDELIDWMITQQGMPAPPANERAKIVSYLSKTYGEDGPAPKTP